MYVTAALIVVAIALAANAAIAALAATRSEGRRGLNTIHAAACSVSALLVVLAVATRNGDYLFAVGLILVADGLVRLIAARRRTARSV